MRATPMTVCCFSGRSSGRMDRVGQTLPHSAQFHSQKLRRKSSQGVNMPSRPGLEDGGLQHVGGADLEALAAAGAGGEEVVLGARARADGSRVDRCGGARPDPVKPEEASD